MQNDARPHDESGVVAVPERSDSGGGPSGLRLGRVFGVPLDMQWSAVGMAVFTGIVFAPMVRWWFPGTGVLAYALALLVPGIVMLSVLAHELGHLLAGRACGVRPTGISLDILGGATHFDRDAESPGREALIAASGPMVSALLAAAGYAALAWGSAEGFARTLVFQFTVLNIVITIFNFLPGLPLDGGWVLRAGLWKLIGRPVLAQRIAAWCGRALAVSLMLYLGWQLATGGHFGALTLIVFAVVAYQIWSGATAALHEPQVSPSPPENRVR